MTKQDLIADLSSVNEITYEKENNEDGYDKKLESGIGKAEATLKFLL